MYRGSIVNKTEEWMERRKNFPPSMEIWFKQQIQFSEFAITSVFPVKEV